MFLYALNSHSFILLSLCEKRFEKFYRVASCINDELFEIEFQDFMIFFPKKQQTFLSVCG